MDLNKIPYQQARWYTPVLTGRPRNKIVVHTMEAPEKGSTAENVARYFATGISERKKGASAHYCIDSDSVVQCVQTRDVAWGAGGANHDGIHLEFAGYAKQSAADWQDPFSQNMLRLAARLCGRVLIPKLAIPVVYLDERALRTPGAKGFTTHHDCSQAFGGSHWDPGPNFPMVQFLGYVMQALRGQL